MEILGDVIASALKNHGNADMIAKNSAIVSDLAKKFPVYF